MLQPTSSQRTYRRNRKDVYHLHIDLSREYEPLCKKNKEHTISEASKENLRAEGKKSVDLWVDGRMYPKHPITGSTPPFKDITSLVNYVGDGHDGLYGYTRHLAARNDILQLERDIVHKENHRFNQTVTHYAQILKGNTETITKLTQQLREKETALGRRQREKRLRDIEQLKVGSGGLKKRVRAIK